MERAILITLITILLAGMAAAEVTVVPTAAPETATPGIFISTASNTVTLSASVPVRDVHVFIDGNEAKTFIAIGAGMTETLTTPLVGEHDVEVRYLRDLSYTWQRPEITKNDEPAKLKYVEYDKDKKRVDFSITSADLIAPGDLGTTAESVNEPFTDYEATLNDKLKLQCYPRITTGQNLFFSCRSDEYANKLDLSMTIGIREEASVNITGTKETTTDEEAGADQEQPLSVPPTPPMPPPIKAQEPAQDEEVPVANNITMTDTIHQKGMPLAVTVLIIALFLAVMAIMFVASHHKHESKQAGTHHPLKKK